MNEYRIIPYLKRITALTLILCTISCASHFERKHWDIVRDDSNELCLFIPAVYYHPTHDNTDLSRAYLRDYIFNREKSSLDYYTRIRKISLCQSNLYNEYEFNNLVKDFFMSIMKNIKNGDEYKYEQDFDTRASTNLVALSLFTFRPLPKKSPGIIITGGNDIFSSIVFILSLSAYCYQKLMDEGTGNINRENRKDGLPDGLYFAIVDNEEKTVIYYSHSVIRGSLNQEELDRLLRNVLSGIQKSTR